MTEEQFQNEVIRPIVKSKHNFIMAYFDDYLHSHKTKLSFENLEVANAQIENIIKKDIATKNIFLGSIIIDFKPEELSYFFENRSNLSSRISGIISKRIFDTLKS